MQRSSEPNLRVVRVVAVVLGMMALLLLPGCTGIEKAPPQSTSTRSTVAFTLDVPEIMRGTVGSETAIRGYQEVTSPGYQPVIARGYGLVVGLNGKGSRDTPPQLREYMLQEAARNGIGNPKFGEEMGSLTAEALLDSMDTAIVIVEAVVPQGAPEGTRFDVRVYAETSSSTQSLEGGMLWTTILRPGNLAMGGKQAADLAIARGPVFLNPFANDGTAASAGVVETAGRVLNGGTVSKDMPLKLLLANPSHARAQVLVMAINTRFPREPGQTQETAHGKSDEIIDITVPPSWYRESEEFIRLLMHTTIAQSNPEAAALFVKRTLVANPVANAEAATYRWQALGTRCLPIIKDLYDYPEESPRMAALRAGAKLDDGLVIPPLVSMAKHGSSLNRLVAVELLESMRSNPQIDICLRDLLNDDDVELRLRAYEALVQRNDPFLDRYDVDGKFVLDVIPSEKPLIYITQVRQPRIAVFGSTLALTRPLTLTAWSNRLMLKGDVDETDIEVFYRDTVTSPGVILHAKPDMTDFVQFLAHRTSIEEPAPGLDLSYGQTVGALYQIWRGRHIDADFKMEQDRILATIRRIQTEGEGMEEDRPELSTTPDDQPMPGSDIGRLGAAPVAVPSNSPAALPRNEQSPK